MSGSQFGFVISHQHIVSVTAVLAILAALYFSISTLNSYAHRIENLEAAASAQALSSGKASELIGATNERIDEVDIRIVHVENFEEAIKSLKQIVATNSGLIGGLNERIDKIDNELSRIDERMLFIMPKDPRYNIKRDEFWKDSENRLDIK